MARPGCQGLARLFNCGPEAPGRRRASTESWPSANHARQHSSMIHERPSMDAEEGLPPQGFGLDFGGLAAEDAPSSKSAARSLVDLQNALRSDWCHFQHSLDDILRQQFTRQQDLIARCVESISAGGAAATAASPPLPRTRASDEPSGARALRLRPLAENVAKVGPRAAGDEEAAAGAGAAVQGQLRWGTGESAGSAAHRPAQPPADGAREAQAVLLQLEGAVQRIESLLVDQDAMMRRFANRTESFSNRPPSPSSRNACHEVQVEPVNLGMLFEQNSPTRIVSHGSRQSGTPERGKSRVTDMLESNRDYARGGSARTRMLGNVGNIIDRTLHRVGGDRYRSLINWWDNLYEPERTGCLADFTRSRSFELLSASVIILNGAFAFYTTNYEISHLDGGPTTAILVVDSLFILYYVVEVILKLCVNRLFFFCNSEWRWNIFDFVIVLLCVFDQTVTLSSGTDSWYGTDSTIDMSFMRILRILRLAKILRGVRVLRFFSELRLIMNSLAGSVPSLLWSIVMMVLIFYVFGLIFVQGVSMHLYYHEDEISKEMKETLLMEFGSVQNAMLSLYASCTGGQDWFYYYRIVEDASPGYAALYVFFIAFSQIAFLNILTAIFVNQAIELAQPDNDTLAIEHRKKEIEACEELYDLCALMDTNENGLVSVDEFQRQLKSGRLAARLSILGLHVMDPDSFFDLLRHASGSTEESLSVADFVEGCMRMRGGATGIDVQTVQQETRRMNRSLQQFQKDYSAKLNQLFGSIEAVCSRSDAAIAQTPQSLSRGSQGRGPRALARD